MYNKMLNFVVNSLEESGGEITKPKFFPFRKRSDHIKRVLVWAERLVDGLCDVNKEAVLVSAIFHDVGYGHSQDNSEHPEESSLICEKYLTENGFDSDFINLVVYLVKNHSNKELMTRSDTELELILLMEADLLDETGALSIVWDCMLEGKEPVQTFEKTYHHIMNYSYKTIKTNPMVTTKAKIFWESKQNFMNDFIKHLSFDLNIQDQKTKRPN